MLNLSVIQEFPSDFIFGVATSSYQIEGNKNGDCGLSIWDDFARKKLNGIDGKEACRHLDFFKEDIKLRIDETAKYIRPNEKTTDYAYMFIPADGLYQDLLNSRVGTLQINSRDLVSYAYTKKVMIVSPMSLFPMLQITVKALHNLKIENSIKDIMKNIFKFMDIKYG